MVTRYKIVYPNELSHYGVKGMKWGVRKDNGSIVGRYYRAKANSIRDARNQRENRKISKYTNKAEKQVSYLKNEEKMFRGKYGDHDDEELFDSLSPAEKRRERKRFTESGKWAAKNAEYWNKAAKDISTSTSSKQAKEKFKKYRKNAGIYVVNP